MTLRTLSIGIVVGVLLGWTSGYTFLRWQVIQVERAQIAFFKSLDEAIAKNETFCTAPGLGAWTEKGSTCHSDPSERKR